MGPEAAVNIIYRRELAAHPHPTERRAELVAEYIARFANPYVAAERGYVDDVIEPRDTRRELINALKLCLRKKVDRPASTATSPCNSRVKGEAAMVLREALWEGLRETPDGTGMARA